MTKQALTRKLTKALRMIAQALEATHARDDAIRALHAEHKLKLRELAELSGLTIGRIQQIVKRGQDLDKKTSAGAGR